MHNSEWVDIGVIVLCSGIIFGFVVLALETEVQSYFWRKRRHQMSSRGEVRS
jgi:hypothetical protein